MKSDPAEKILIGKGLTSEVYAWGEGRVLKLYFHWVPAARVAREFSVTRAIHSSGLSVPAAHEMIEVDGRQGIVFERVEGISIFKQVEARPWTLFAAARLLGELHARLHECPAPAQLPEQREQIGNRIEAAADFSPAQKQSARECLARLPSGEALCHGDFHPNNILMGKGGPVIIDWSAASRGHPLGDVARTSVLFQMASLPEGTPRHILLLFKCSRALLHSTYLKRYLQLRPGSKAELEAWRPPLMAAVSAWRTSREF